MIDDLIERIIDENDLTSDQKLAMLKIIVSRKKETRKEHSEELNTSPLEVGSAPEFWTGPPIVPSTLPNPFDHAVVDSPVIVKYGIPGPFLNDSGEKEETEEKPGFGSHR